MLQRIVIEREHDALEACRKARNMAQAMGFKHIAAYHIATSVSELATNLVRHGGGGVVLLSPVVQETRSGMEVTTLDEGPGIVDIALALSDGYSTAGGLGFGLPGVKRLMDHLEIVSTPGLGTQVRAIKWL